MSSLQWRSFSFFQLVQQQTDLSANIQGEISCSTAARGQIFLADSSGQIHTLTQSALTSKALAPPVKAFDRTITHLYAYKSRPLLVAIGYDDVDTFPLLKLFRLISSSSTSPSNAAGQDFQLGLLELVRSVKVSVSGESCGVTCLNVSESPTSEGLLVLGLGNGLCLLFRGDLLKDRYLRQKVLQESYKDKGQVTGLSFAGNGSILYVATDSSITGYALNAYSSEFAQVFTETGAGCMPRCSTLNKITDEFVVARSEAIYLYGQEGRGPCFILDDLKRAIFSFKSYIVIIGRERNKTSGGDRVGVLVYDLKSKLIAFSHYFESDVVEVVSEWGFLFILTANKKMFQVQEKDTSAKMDMLFKKNLYQLAVNLAYNSSLDQRAISDIYRKFGDHLYSKGDFDAAIEQYLLTIGTLEPSYVILKFLDAQRIHNLTTFLQALHEKNLASVDHTTLLLNCYAKLRDSQRLNNFIKSEKQVYFDVETAIDVCRSSGYCEHAVYLADKYERYDVYVQIQVEDLENFSEAIAYISKLSFKEAEKAMKLYGRSLVSKLPEESSQLLLKLCTGTHMDKGNNAARSRPEDFIHNFVNRKKWLTIFLESYLEIDTHCESATIWDTLFELYMSPSDDASPDADDPQLTIELQTKAALLLRNSLAKYDDDHVMILCQLHGFRPGILYLLEKMGLYQDIIQFHMDHDEYRQIIASCRKHASQDPDLWVQVLTYFVERPNDHCNEEIAEVLAEIDKLGLMTPLRVVEILSGNESMTLGIVKDYVLKRVKERSEVIEENEAKIASYREEIANVQRQIDEIHSGCVVFQNTKCTVCNSPLELPAVHFLCKHSYHIRCLGENEKECPKCAPEHRLLLEMQETLLRGATQHEDFFRQLEGTEDGFSVIAEYLGRNVFIKAGNPLLSDKR